MKRLYSIVVITVAVCCAAPVAAQTQTPAAPATPTVAGPTVNLGYAGLLTGQGTVQRTSRVLGAEGGARVWRNLDLFVEGGQFRDLVTRRQLEIPAPLVTYLQKTQGKAATADVRVPGSYGAVGARWVFENLKMPLSFPLPARLYAQVAFGRASLEMKPTFTLGGADVTAALAQYGVTLGGDLTQKSSAPAYGAGLGVLVPYKMLYGDIGVRALSIKTAGQSTTVGRFHVGIGVRF